MQFFSVLLLFVLSFPSLAWHWPWTSFTHRFVNHVSQWSYEHGHLKCEVHDNIQTDDGYVLTAFRLRAQKGAHGTPIMVQHGYMDSAWGWVLSDDNIAKFLWNNGYDVWLTNNRGNTYSRKHIKYTTSEERYWDFTMPEFALYDLPANLQHIARVTGYKKFPYMGHSQGTTQVFIAASDWTSDRVARRHDAERREHVKKIVQAHIEDFIALSPVYFLANTDCMPCKVGSNLKVIDIYMLFNRKGMLFNQVYLQRLLNFACDLPGISDLCGFSSSMIVGPSTKDQGYKLDQWFENFPAGVSVRDTQMWQQWVNADRMETELGHTVSHVNVSSLSVPTHFFYGLQDYLVSATDRLAAQKLLANNKFVKNYFYFEDFSHATWQIGDETAQKQIHAALCKVLKCNPGSEAYAVTSIPGTPAVQMNPNTIQPIVGSDQKEEVRMDPITNHETIAYIAAYATAEDGTGEGRRFMP